MSRANGDQAGGWRGAGWGFVLLHWNQQFDNFSLPPPPYPHPQPHPHFYPHPRPHPVLGAESP